MTAGSGQRCSEGAVRRQPDRRRPSVSKRAEIGLGRIDALDQASELAGLKSTFSILGFYFFHFLILSILENEASLSKRSFQLLSEPETGPFPSILLLPACPS
jgi:hypothetical protein